MKPIMASRRGILSWHPVMAYHGILSWQPIMASCHNYHGTCHGILSWHPLMASYPCRQGVLSCLLPRTSMAHITPVPQVASATVDTFMANCNAGPAETQPVLLLLVGALEGCLHSLTQTHNNNNTPLPASLSCVSCKFPTRPGHGWIEGSIAAHPSWWDRHTRAHSRARTHTPQTR